MGVKKNERKRGKERLWVFVVGLIVLAVGTLAALPYLSGLLESEGSETEKGTCYFEIYKQVEEDFEGMAVPVFNDTFQEAEGVGHCDMLKVKCERRDFERWFKVCTWSDEESSCLCEAWAGMRNETDSKQINQNEKTKSRTMRFAFLALVLVIATIGYGVSIRRYVRW